jgi:membrane-associated protease RseP (regulator of RpoE activity)
MLKRYALHGGLFFLTVLSTWYVVAVGYDAAGVLVYRPLDGLIYSVSIMTILLAHEMGHYLVSRRYGVTATLPFFIPFPFSPFGTFGAVIKMRGVIADKKALFDIGVAGPLSGFILSLPCAFIGVALSHAVKVDPSSNPVTLGEPLLLKLFERVLVGELPHGYDLLIHPLGFAGWVGLFVTALNLLPVGQLDGGHIVYAAFGSKSKFIPRVLIILLLLFAVFYNAGWLVLAVLLMVFGLGHPDPVDPFTPLDGKRKVLALAMLAVFVLSFVPAPFEGTGILDLVRTWGK